MGAGAVVSDQHAETVARLEAARAELAEERAAHDHFAGALVTAETERDDARAVVARLSTDVMRLQGELAAARDTSFLAAVPQQFPAAMGTPAVIATEQGLRVFDRMPAGSVPVCAACEAIHHLPLGSGFYARSAKGYIHGRCSMCRRVETGLWRSPAVPAAPVTKETK
jgi:hypothetical protein